MSDPRLDRKAERVHRQRLEHLLLQLPHADTTESRAMADLLRRVIGRGDATGSGKTWRGRRQNH
jgi:hypothetical protein